jgi:triosephosphate isomerase
LLSLTNCAKIMPTLTLREKVMRKILIAGNWKMHGAIAQITSLVTAITGGLVALAEDQKANAAMNVATKNLDLLDILVLPTFVHLPLVQGLIVGSCISLGAQNLYLGPQGAFTGEVSGPMLKELGCQYVLVGHSERRTIFHEDMRLVAAKFQAAQAAELIPILCVGETKEEREAGKTQQIIQAQLDTVVQLVGIEAFDRAVIAYEPVWAIGTGLTASPEEAQKVHAFIRHHLDLHAHGKNTLDIAKTIRILYGGSMKADNAAALLAMPDIDGGLIGGASLIAESFLSICVAATKQSTFK